MGYFIALSQAGQVKSVAYPKVRTIIFDEIFPDNMRYIGGEVTALEEFYNTVDRWNDRVRVIMCSNAVTLANPYFSAFNINLKPQLDNHTQYQRYCDGFVMVELADYGGFSAKVATSKFGTFLRKYDENYANYAIDNDFRDNANTLISDFNNAGYAFTLRTTEYGIFNVYQQLSDTDEVLYVITKKQPKITRDFTFDYRLVDNNCMMLKRSDDMTQKILNAYRVGRLRFETPQIKAEFSMILGGLLQQSGVRK